MIKRNLQTGRTVLNWGEKVKRDQTGLTWANQRKPGQKRANGVKPGKMGLTGPNWAKPGKREGLKKTDYFMTLIKRVGGYLAEIPTS